MNVPKPRQCQHPGCTTWTLRKICFMHRALLPPPVGPWAELERMRDEQEPPVGIDSERNHD